MKVDFYLDALGLEFVARSKLFPPSSIRMSIVQVFQTSLIARETFEGWSSCPASHGLVALTVRVVVTVCRSECCPKQAPYWWEEQQEHKPWCSEPAEPWPQGQHRFKWKPCDLLLLPA